MISVIFVGLTSTTVSRLGARTALIGCLSSCQVEISHYLLNQCRLFPNGVPAALHKGYVASNTAAEMKSKAGRDQEKTLQEPRTCTSCPRAFQNGSNAMIVLLLHHT